MEDVGLGRETVRPLGMGIKVNVQDSCVQFRVKHAGRTKA